MTTSTRADAAHDLQQTAAALIARYPTSTPAQTESGIAIISLWALEAVETGRLSPQDAGQVLTLLEVKLGDSERAGGPDLSDDTGQLLLEGMTLDDWGTEFSADPARMRALAFAILQTLK